jgi:hypothetical protein
MSTLCSSTPKLNANLFHLIKSIDQKEEVYSFYQPLGGCMVLQCIDGTPLAAIHVAYAHDKDTNKATILQSDTETFRALLNTPNQSIVFHITNLTDYREDIYDRHSGMVNINLMPTKELAMGVNEVNPGGYNQVNEISPFETYTIEGNQISEPYKNARFLIQELFKPVPDSAKSKTVTVEEDEKTGKSSESFVIWPIVHAQTGSESLASKFELGTRWVTAKDLPWFYIKSKKPTPIVYRSGRVTESLQFGHSHVPVMRFGQDISSPSFSIDNHNYDGSHLQSATTSFFLARTTRKKHAGHNIGLSKSKRAKSSSSSPDDANEDSDMSDSKLIQSSNITTLANGESVDVHSSETDADYHFNFPSPICKIGFSIQRKLTFNQAQVYYNCNNDDSLNVDFREAIDIDQKGKYKEFIEKEKNSEKNKDPTCYICLEGSPDVMFCCCGHIGAHKKCIQGHVVEFCGLCRTIISAQLIV